MTERRIFLADSNVLLDLATDDAVWLEWSAHQLTAAAAQGLVVVNPVIYAEVALAYDTIETLDAALADLSLEILPIPRDALFLAGRVFQQYRRRGGTRTNVLPDCFIGAHAAVTEMILITRDSRRRHWFPTVTVVSPDTTAG